MSCKQKLMHSHLMLPYFCMCVVEKGIKSGKKCEKHETFTMRRKKEGIEMRFDVFDIESDVFASVIWAKSELFPHVSQMKHFMCSSYPHNKGNDRRYYTHTCYLQQKIYKLRWPKMSEWWRMKRAPKISHSWLASIIPPIKLWIIREYNEIDC